MYSTAHNGIQVDSYIFEHRQTHTYISQITSHVVSVRKGMDEVW